MLVIDPEECIDCGACEPECPVEAIFPEDALPDKWAPFVKINYAYDQGFGVIDELVNDYATEHDVQNKPLDEQE
jgi:ferredoxin